jgi:hypothetical protein
VAQWGDCTEFQSALGAHAERNDKLAIEQRCWFVSIRSRRSCREERHDREWSRAPFGVSIRSRRSCREERANQGEASTYPWVFQSALGAHAERHACSLASSDSSTAPTTPSPLLPP